MFFSKEMYVDINIGKPTKYFVISVKITLITRESSYHGPQGDFKTLSFWFFLSMRTNNFSSITFRYNISLHLLSVNRHLDSCQCIHFNCNSYFNQKKSLKMQRFKILCKKRQISKMSSHITQIISRINIYLQLAFPFGIITRLLNVF